ncbi:embryonic polyadenylate-binding protein 2 [Sorex araneus]|uniref:embryonic polyadenylate-binding protein 2 n=1 Tax=Sorex araneus TaxID=42254 RepID=UPI000331700B|nr:embryonic polyadenylate-binding protein 2 [Sorex araneus]
MWPPLGNSLFPPPSEDWLQRASSDPAAQGWGAWSRTEVTPVGAHGGEQTDTLLSVWEGKNPAECPAATPVVCRGEAEGSSLPARGWSCPRSPTAVAADHRSVYVGNVDYGGSALELGAHFTHCGDIHRVTILCDKFSGHPKGYAYIEFASESSVRAAQGLDCSIFRGRVLKVLPKRTNIPGISSTDRGGLQRCRGARDGASFRFRPQRWSR